MIGEELAGELAAAARRMSAAIAASGDAFAETRRCERELADARHAWDELVARLAHELVMAKPDCDHEGTVLDHPESDTWECLRCGATGQVPAPVEPGPPADPDDEPEVTIKAQVCGVCHRERTIADHTDYHPAQVIMGAPLGWYSGDDGEVCGPCMAQMIRGQ